MAVGALAKMGDAMKQPRYWKQIKRHHLSAEYEDLKGPAWKAFLAGIKEHGMGTRVITLHDGEILDGWQFQRACIELDIKPKYAELKGMTPEEYVGIHNDHRRHETPERAMERIEARRERVAKARENGQSVRTIADSEGVSLATVQRDLQEKPPTVSPDTVTGKDGRKQPATRAERLGIRPPTPFTFKERDAGDDTEQIKADRKSNAKPGKVIFDDRKIIDLFGKLVRLTNDRAKAYGLKDIPSKLKNGLDTYLQEFKAWQKAS